MFPEVVEEVLLVPVLFVTCRTLKLLLFSMHRHVPPQLGRSGTALSAVDAVVAVDTIMDPTMDVASLARSEPSTADRTVVHAPVAASTNAPRRALATSGESSSLHTADDKCSEFSHLSFCFN